MTIACPDCGVLQDLPPLRRGTAAVCPDCDHSLERTSGRSQGAAFAFALATLILLFPANTEPLLRISMLGVDRESHLGSGVITLWNNQWVIVAVLVAAFAVVLPFIRFALLSLVLGCLRGQRRPAWLGRAFRWSMQLDRWAMPDVFLLGAAVGYSRVAASLPVHIGWGGICLILAAVCAMLSRATLDRRTVWRALESEREPLQPDEPAISCIICDCVVAAHSDQRCCPRCGSRLSARKPAALVRTLALVLAGLAFYVPANIYPMSTDVQLGELVGHRIVDGIAELFQAGLWPLGVLIFCTSIAIPLLKLIGLSWLLVSVRRRSRRGLVFKTKLYRVIDEVGRWSNVDVFTIAVFVPLLQFGQLATAQASTGATAFILVVALTMIAVRTFDPRMMWDAALGARA
ncbi:MAG TPA: paraquat-inducible protein A [Steroidobacteraceae bacterium]